MTTVATAISKPTTASVSSADKPPASITKMPGMTDEQTKKRSNVLQLIKSLLNSAQGDLTLDQLARDYKQMVDEIIPFKEVQHASLASLLQSAPEIVQLVPRGGVLYARTSHAARDHIATLVTGQRPAVKKLPPSRGWGRGHAMRRPTSYRPSHGLLPIPQSSCNNNYSRRPGQRPPFPFRPNNNNSTSYNNGNINSLPPRLQASSAAKNLFNAGRKPPQRRPLLGFDSKPFVVNPANVNLNAPSRPTIPQRQPVLLNNNVQDAAVVCSGSNRTNARSFNGNASSNNVSNQYKPPPRQQQAPAVLNNKKFYVSNNIQIPRPQRNTTHNFPPYCEVPPRFMKGKGSSNTKGPKQHLEQLAKEMGFTDLVFRTIPYSKNWLATVSINGDLYSSFPDERPNVGEAEDVVAQKALDGMMAAKKDAESHPVTADHSTCLTRVKELVIGELHGVWLSHLRERYQCKYQENLPQQFCDTCTRQQQLTADAGVVLTRHENLWIISCTQNSKVETSSSHQPQFVVEDQQQQPHSLPVTGYHQHQQQQEPKSLPPLHSQQQRQQQYENQQQYYHQRQDQHTQPQSLPSIYSSLPPQQKQQQMFVQLPLHLQSPPPSLQLQSPTTTTTYSSSISSTTSSYSPMRSLNSSASSSLQSSLQSLSVQQTTHTSVGHNNNSSSSDDNLKTVVNHVSDVSKNLSVTASKAISVGNDSDVSNNSSTTVAATTTAATFAAEMEALVSADVVQPPILKLPEEDQWEVYVSHISDDNKICFRLLGDDYNDCYEELMTEMELHYYGKSKCTPPGEIKLGHYYVLHHDETWDRVLITAITESSVSALFVDHGDTEEVSKEHIYELPPKFLELPCQYVQASLAELDGIRCEALTTGLKTSVLGRSFVAQVTARYPYLQVVLIDTSSDEDVNINDKLVELLPESFTKPQLPQVGGIAEVFLTSVRDDGRLFVTIESETYTMLEHMLLATKIKAEELPDGEGEIDLTKLYLARFAADSDWHRVRPRNGNIVNNKVLCACVDWGTEEQVPRHLMHILQQLAPSLAKLPPQALECVLANVPPAGHQWSRKATKRLEELQPQAGPILLKNVGVNSSGQTQVLLFKRLQPKNELISINETLAMDIQLFGESSEASSTADDSSSMSSSSDHTPSSRKSSPAKTAPVTVDTPILSPPDLPSVCSMFDVYVTYAANPDNFAVQACGNYSELEKLRRDMQSYYDSDESKEDTLQLKQIVVGGYYAALHTDDYWYRVRVSSIMGENKGDLICGKFVDFGDCFVSSSDRVKKLLPRFAVLPYQSIRAAISGICPINKDWMPEDTCRFRDLVQDKEFVTYVAGVALDPSINQDQPTLAPSLSSVSGKATVNTRLLLRLIDTSEKDKDVYIDQLMIKEGRARSASGSSGDDAALLITNDSEKSK